MSLETKPYKVSWQDGTLLLPHHFQQADRYLDSQLRMLAQAEAPLAWGVLSLTWDEAELGLGRVCLKSCRGLLGESERIPVDIPAVDAPPSPVAVPADAESLDIFLILPKEEAARFRKAALRTFNDLYSERSEAIAVADKSFALCLDSRPPEQPHLHLGRLRRSQGALTLRTDFIPPALTLTPYIEQRLGEILAAIGGQRRELEGALAARQLKEAQRLYLYILQQQEPVLWHLLHTAQKVHPSVLFQELLRLAGGLRVVQPEYALLKAHLKYDHRQLNGCMSTLLDTVTQLLAERPLVRSAGESLQPLSAEPSNMRWLGRLAIREGRRYFLMLPPGLSMKSRKGIEDQCRVAHPDDLDDYICDRSSMMLVARDHDSGLPEELGEAGTYFELDTASPIWRQICEAGQLAVYVPRTLFEKTAPSVQLISAARRER